MKRWQIQEKNFYTLIFLFWPLVAFIFAALLVYGASLVWFIVTLGSGSGALFYLAMMFLVGSLFFYKYYICVMLPFAIWARYLGEDGRILLIFASPQIVAFVFSWWKTSEIMGSIFYISLCIAWIYVFIFLYFLGFVKKINLLVPDVKKS